MEVGVLGIMVVLLAGMAIGAGMAWLYFSGRKAASESQLAAHAAVPFQSELATLHERCRTHQQEAADWKTRLALASSQLEELRESLASLRESSAQEIGRLSAQLHAEQARSQADGKHFDEKLQLLLNAKEALTNQFKTLAGEILDEKSKRLKQQSEENLGQLLEPLKARLSEFKTKVEEVYIQEGKDRSALAGQVQQLFELNQSLSSDAKNLTLALKGSSKTQGNWGELVLERVLEAAGLRKGFEYDVQVSEVREDGSRVQPDVVINLPEERKLVVDSKLSLTAYERHVRAESDIERAAQLRLHLDSLRAHIRGLSEKRYQDLYGIRSPDFVIAFVPIEPAFLMAVTNDENLWIDAWRLNVILVSPSTLLFVVRTVAALWRQEAQKTNAQEIAKRGSELYDKLCGFVDDLENVGTRLAQAQKAYEGAHAKLVGGRGNVIRQAEMLRELGVKPTKSLPEGMTEAAAAADEAVVVLQALSEKSAGETASTEADETLSSGRA